MIGDETSQLIKHIDFNLVVCHLQIYQAKAYNNNCMFDIDQHVNLK